MYASSDVFQPLAVPYGLITVPGHLSPLIAVHCGLVGIGDMSVSLLPMARW